MASSTKPEKQNQPHAVCIPFPAQGHINPMTRLAKLLHHRGFHVTFVNTEYNHRRLLKSHGPALLSGDPSFRFETIPDGLPPTDADATQDIPSLCESTRRTCLGPFRDLLARLNASGDVPPVSCIVSHGAMSFTLDAAEEIGVPEVLFWSMSACGFLAYMHYQDLVHKGLIPLKDESYLTNGYLNTIIDWVPGMKDMRLKDFPSFIRTTDPTDNMIDFIVHETGRAKRASAVVFNTFHALERASLDALSSILPCPVYSVGPLDLLVNNADMTDQVGNIRSNLWKEDASCLDWLHGKEPNSVVYVNYGSITVMTNEQLVEFAWGLANSKKTFLWVIRNDLVAGDSAVLPPEFVAETRERGLLAGWCDQVEVLNHPAVGVFLTHCGWNSTLESLCAGVPVICCPFFAEQQTNCRYCCREWGVGVEIDGGVRREGVAKMVVEVMEGERGEEMKRKAVEWKEAAREAAGDDGLSRRNLDELVRQVLMMPKELSLKCNNSTISPVLQDVPVL